jgi:hypothetical protein
MWASLLMKKIEIPYVKEKSSTHKIIRFPTAMSERKNHFCGQYR